VARIKPSECPRGHAILTLGNTLPDGDTKESVMTRHDKPVELESVQCAVCMKEVPISEATVPEASDYVVHFCGLECYEKWKEQGDKSNAQTTSPGS
jgi:hypothetical protein